MKTGSVFGIEQEFEVHDTAGHVDFRRWIHRPARASSRVACPAGPSGYYLTTGTLLICDGWEAELAAPPEDVTRTLCGRVPRLARRRQAELLDDLDRLATSGGPSLSLRGYSTHLNASCIGVDVAAVSRVYARTMAPAMMLLLDVRTSPGLLVRPHRRRFEIGGDFPRGDDQLSAASAFFLASFLATVDAVVGRREHELPLAFDPAAIEDTWQRRAANIGASHEVGAIAPVGKGKRALFRQGDADHVPFDAFNERQLSHYHPPGGPWMRPRLPSPRDVSLGGSARAVVVSRRAEFHSRSVASVYLSR